MLKTTNILLYVCLGLLLASCITAIDEALPYEQLPEITVATQFNLVASPSHPTAYLPTDPILVGERVQVIGTDKDAKWLLVLHDNRLGWMPTFYFRDNIGRLKPAIVVEPLSDKCTKYLGATFAPDETWVSNASGATFVVGSIYRPQAETPFEEAALAPEIDGSGTTIASDYLHTSLTASSALVLFAYSINDLGKDSQISFNLTNPGNEPLFFEAIFFSNDCADNLDELSIGKKKTLVTEPASVQTDDNRQPETTKGPVIIRPSGQSSNAQQVSDCIQPPDGLVSWWPGDGNADDIVGVNDGKLVGSVEFMDGMVGQAFRFDGINDIVMATATDLPAGAAPRTVAFWAKTAPSANNATGFGYGDEASGKGFYVFPAHSETGGRLIFSSHGSAGVVAPYNLKDGQYHHIAVTYDRSTATVYVDGVVVAAGNFGIDTGTSGGACIGGRCYLGEFFTGEVDEVAIWNRNLSASEIEEMFNAGSAGMCKPGATPESQAASTTAEAANNQFLYTSCVNDNCDVYLWDIQDKRSKRIIDDPGWDSFATWSPKGERMIFTSRRSGNYQLYLFDFSSNRIVKQLTQSIPPKNVSAWSPDGKHILYQEFIDNVGWQIGLLDLETMETKRLTQAGINEFPQWSPAGDKILFGAARSDSNNNGQIDYDDNYHIYIMDTDGNNVYNVTNDPNYQELASYWMPDGIHTVSGRFVKGQTFAKNGPGEIYIVNVNTGDTKALTFTSADERYAVPSPDGRQFLITVLEGGKQKIYLASWDGDQLGEPEFLVEGYLPTWRPDK